MSVFQAYSHGLCPTGFYYQAKDFTVHFTYVSLCRPRSPS